MWNFTHEPEISRMPKENQHVPQYHRVIADLTTESALDSEREEVLSALTAAVPGGVAMAGPTLLGELPRGQNRFDALFERYVEINEWQAAAHNVSYANMRDVFFSVINAAHWQRPYGLLTKSDQMHHNRYGGKVVESVLRGLLLGLYDGEHSK